MRIIVNIGVMSIYIAMKLLSVWMRIDRAVAKCEKDQGCEKDRYNTILATV